MANPQWPDFEIPPVGLLTPEDVPDYFRLVEDWKIESKMERDKWVEPVRNACLDLFYTGQHPKPPDSKVIPNHIKNNCIRAKDVMLKEPAAVEVKPVDDGGPPLAYYWNGPSNARSAQVDPITGQPASDQQGQPLQNPGQYESMGVPPDLMINGQLVAEPFDEIAAGQLSAMCQQMGFPQEWIVPVDSKLLGDIYQKPFDSFWRDCHADEWLDSYAMMVVKSGWETGQLQWDTTEHHSLETIPATQVFPDVRHQFVWDMDRFIITRVYPVGMATRLFPHKAQLLAEKAKPGLPTTTGATSFGYKDLRDFKGKVVTLTTIWIKDQPAPKWMTEQQALTAGLAAVNYIQPVLSPAEVMQQLPTETPQPVKSSVTDAKTGEPLLTNDDGKVWHESFGMVRVLRQSVFLDADLIEDDVCPWPKIPIIHACCIGVEDNPYGYGLPWGARHSQYTYSTATESIDGNTQFYGNAAAWLPASVHAKMVKEFGRAFLMAGDVLSLEPTDIPASGKLQPFIEPPEIPESLIVARQGNKADLDEIMGMQQALRGEPVTADPSGVLQNEAAMQASGLITAMSKQLQGAIGHIADLMLYSIIHFAPVDEIFKTCRKVRKEVLAAIHLRHAPAIKWQTNALLTGGAGSKRDRQKQEALQLNQTIDQASGKPLLDAESVQEAFNRDPELINQRNTRAQQQAQAMALQNAVQQQQVAPAPAKGNGSSNGNGSKNGRHFG